MVPMEMKNVESCVINTGNILSINDITRKSGQNPTEELTEAINITVREYQNGTEAPPPNGKLTIFRPNDDLKVKLEEQALTDLKIGVKLFLKDDSGPLLLEAINETLNTLKVPSIQNVIVQYKRVAEVSDEVTSLRNIWTVLEEYVKEEKISQLGLADVEEATFRNIYQWAHIKPAIIQINLATCCVVPPTLQAFCKENDVQLLTHSDPSEIITKGSIDDILGLALPLRWISRFSVHIKCRGVLCSKGYLIALGEK